MASRWRRFAVATACAPLALLAGCPQQQTATPTAASAKVTAPAASAQPLPAQPPATPLSAAQGAAQQQRVQVLITRAEGMYQSGVTNYRTNHLESARADFDAAVDAMLTSGMDLKSDPQLASEFDRLLNAINTLEMSALKQGNGFSPQIEESPVESAADITFPPNPELVAKLKTELNTTSDLPLVINDQVAGYINVFSESNAFRAHMAASLQRVGKYRGLIQSVLSQEGVPQDLIYLAVAESGFQPQAINPRSGAGGMWQFMTYTAPEYGLTRNGYFDYRFDPEKSTRAYARLIKNYYELFGDWYLAMAAYDWGPGNIQRVVQRTGYADFWELYRRNTMPAETREYVPKILAAVIMAKNPERYGLDKLKPSPPLIYDTVSTDYTIDLRLVADVTDVDVLEIVALNPSLLRQVTPKDIPFDLHIPPGTKELYTKRMAAIPEDKRNSWRFHVVRAGETLERIATDFHTHPAEIQAGNNLASSDSIATGDELVIPAAAPTASSQPAHYVSRKGDTLVTIADRFNVSAEQLRRWNHLTSNVIPAHRTLAVSEPLRFAHEVRVRGKAGRGATAVAAHAGKSASHASSPAASHKAAHAPATRSAAAKSSSKVRTSATRSKRASK